ncbi:hypothetical protein Bbelb_167000 [Branchiostoma belcheri]|nr:hypothetical protein Bbelb_167000 [Branchiostoma belcheri]
MLMSKSELLEQMTQQTNSDMLSLSDFPAASRSLIEGTNRRWPSPSCRGGVLYRRAADGVSYLNLLTCIPHELGEQPFHLEGGNRPSICGKPLERPVRRAAIPFTGPNPPGISSGRSPVVLVVHTYTQQAGPGVFSTISTYTTVEEHYSEVSNDGLELSDGVSHLAANTVICRAGLTISKSFAKLKHQTRGLESGLCVRSCPAALKQAASRSLVEAKQPASMERETLPLPGPRSDWNWKKQTFTLADSFLSGLSGLSGKLPMGKGIWSYFTRFTTVKLLGQCVKSLPNPHAPLADRQECRCFPLRARTCKDAKKYQRESLELATARGRPRKTWIESVEDTRLATGRQLSIPTASQTVQVRLYQASGGGWREQFAALFSPAEQTPLACYLSI